MSVNNRRALSGSGDNTLRLWDVDTGRCLLCDGALDQIERSFPSRRAGATGKVFTCTVCGSAQVMPRPSPDVLAKTYSEVYFRSWESRLKDIRKRITDKSNRVDRMLGKGRARQAIDRLTVEIERVQQRIALASLPKPRRWARVITLWRGGFYSGFSGWRSALKDAVVP